MSKKKSFKWPGRSFFISLVQMIRAHSLRLAMVGFLVAFGFMVQRSIYADPTFALKHVEIQVSGQLKPSDVFQWSGLKKGTHILDVDLEVIEKRLRRQPAVKWAQVNRVMPDSLRIFVSERRVAVALQPNPGTEHRLFVDEEGFVIPPPPARVAAYVPMVVDPALERSALEVGTRYEHPLFTAIKVFLKALSESTTLRLSDLAYIQPKDEGDLDVKLKTGPRLVLRENFDKKLLALAPFVEEIRAKEQTIEYLDFRFEDLVIKRMAHGKKRKA